MYANGLIEEIQSLLNNGFSPETNNSLNTVGVKEVFRYLRNEIKLDEALNLIKQNSRRYAKRQMTWFNADKRIKWVNVNDFAGPELCSQYILSLFK